MSQSISKKNIVCHRELLLSHFSFTALAQLLLSYSSRIHYDYQLDKVSDECFNKFFPEHSSKIIQFIENDYAIILD
jgi:hypothetical protein